jgi:hypothetical protein
VVGEREKVHAEPSQLPVDGFGLAIAFAAECAQHRSSAGPGVIAVDVQVASHADNSEISTLNPHYSPANRLKIKLVTQCVT